MKRNRIIKIVIAIVAAVIALWFSFYTEPLSEKLKREQAGLFDADACVKEQWNNLIQLNTDAIDIEDFYKQLSENRKQLAETHGRVLGVGSNIFFVVKGEGKVSLKDDEALMVEAVGQKWEIPMKYLFGNLARDASACFNIDDFKTMTDFNAVSAALNKQVMENVLKPAGRKAAVGKTAVFCAAIEVGNDYFSDNDENQPFSSVPQLIPYTLDIK